MYLLRKAPKRPTIPPRESIINPIKALLKALTTTPLSIPAIQKTFSQIPPPLIHEHGLPQLAPFLGRTFTGAEGVKRYFEILGETLSIEKMEFEDEKGWVVDCEGFTVSLRGEARFGWKGMTGQVWDETFIYRIALVRVGEGSDEFRVSEYRVWADTGAAYLARTGRLREVIEGGCGEDEDEEGELPNRGVGYLLGISEGGGR